jgi:Zn-dependent protease with chaperone function
MTEKAIALRNALIHPVDEIAQGYLRSRIKEDSRIQRFLNSLLADIEQHFYLRNLADNLLVTPKSHPRLYRLVSAAMDPIGLDSIPLYLDTNSAPNAWTLGEKTPGIVITHSLVDLLSDDELLFVLGHELGHIAALHSRHRLMLMQFEPIRIIMSMVPFVGTAFATGYQIALHFWFRRAELTCDRFGLVACGDPGPAMSALTKLGGGQAVLDAPAITETMMLQAEEFRVKYHERSESAVLWDVFDGIIAETATRTHPWAAVRVWELSHWQETEHFRLVMSGDLTGAATVRRDTPSFFKRTVTPGDDPFRMILGEASAEFGKGLSSIFVRAQDLFQHNRKEES